MWCEIEVWPNEYLKSVEVSKNLQKINKFLINDRTFYSSISLHVQPKNSKIFSQIAPEEKKLGVWPFISFRDREAKTISAKIYIYICLYIELCMHFYV